MSEPTPLFDATTAALDPTAPTPVDAPVDTTPAPGLTLPAGPNLDDLQAFTDNIPDEGHRAIAQHLVDAFTTRDAQLVAFIDAYATAEAAIGALQADVATLQQQVAALQPAPVPDPVPVTPTP